MSGVVIVLLAVLSAAPPLTEQQKKDAVNHLPQHARITHDRVTYAAFELDPFKELLVISYDHLLYQQAEKAYREQISLLLRLADNLEVANGSYQKSLDALMADHARLTKKWTEENYERRKAEMAAASPWPWVIMGLGAGVAGAGGIGIGFDYSNGWAWGAAGVGVGLIAIGLVDAIL